MVTGQVFAMIPVSGILGGSVKDIDFNYKHIRALYSMSFLCFGTLETIFALTRIVQNGFKIEYAGLLSNIFITNIISWMEFPVFLEGLIFFIMCMVRAYYLFHLATQWRKVMIFWYNKEYVFLSHPYRSKGLGISLKLKLLFAIFMICAFSMVTKCWRKSLLITIISSWVCSLHWNCLGGKLQSTQKVQPKASRIPAELFQKTTTTAVEISPLHWMGAPLLSSMEVLTACSLNYDIFS